MEDIVNINLIGPQGSGKGTQAQLLADRLGMVNMMTSQTVLDNLDVLPPEEKDHFMKTYNAGELWPGDLVAKILYAKMNDFWKEGKGVVLDAYPRNEDQMLAFEKLLKADGKDWDVFKFVNIEISREEGIKRLSTRLSCGKCRRAFIKVDELKEGDKCSHCGDVLEIRSDDRDRKAIEVRLDIFYKDTKPLLEHLGKKGLVYNVKGEQPIEDVYEEIIKVLDIK